MKKVNNGKNEKEKDNFKEEFRSCKATNPKNQATPVDSSINRNNGVPQKIPDEREYRG